jgi:hypothetical protein
MSSQQNVFLKIVFSKQSPVGAEANNLVQKQKNVVSAKTLFNICAGNALWRATAKICLIKKH